MLKQWYTWLWWHLGQSNWLYFLDKSPSPSCFYKNTWVERQWFSVTLYIRDLIPALELTRDSTQRTQVVNVGRGSLSWTSGDPVLCVHSTPSRRLSGPRKLSRTVWFLSTWEKMTSTERESLLPLVSSMQAPRYTSSAALTTPPAAPKRNSCWNWPRPLHTILKSISPQGKGWFGNKLHLLKVGE